MSESNMARRPRERHKRKLKQVVEQLDAQIDALAGVAQDFTDERYKRYSAGFEVATQGLEQAKQVIISLDAII